MHSVRPIALETLLLKGKALEEGKWSLAALSGFNMGLSMGSLHCGSK